MASEIQNLSERAEQLSLKTNELGGQNGNLQKKCEQQQIQLSESEDRVSKFTQQVDELQQQHSMYSNEITELRKGARVDLGG